MIIINKTHFLLYKLAVSSNQRYYRLSKEVKMLANNNDNIQTDEYSYGYIIEALTGGLYHNKFHVIREYIQNSYDAIQSFKREHNYEETETPMINVYFDGPSIIIYDNGIGMNRDKLNHYRKIGYSEKIMGESVGFRGIGKLSGLSVSQKLIVTSKQKGTQNRHKITFDARAMLEEIMTLKAEGENVSLNSLIEKYTEIVTEMDDDINKHFTIVELLNVEGDSVVLFNQHKMAEYISLNCPVRFNPEFKYAEEIENKIKTFVPSYSAIPVLLNGKEIFKSYIEDSKPAEFITVWESDNDENDEEPSIIAFCWYCENKYSGQFQDKENSGLLFKFNNFTIGDRQLTRTALWRSTPERAFNFFGEIFVTMSGILPSSERSNFEHNEAREKLYEMCQIIPKTLNKIARHSSEKHRANTKLKESQLELEKIHKGIKEKKIPAETQFHTALKALQIVTDMEKRQKFLDEDDQKKAKDVIDKGSKILKILNPRDSQNIKTSENADESIFIETEANKSKEKDFIYDIKKELNLGHQASRVYDIIVNVLKDEFVNNSKLLEIVLEKIRKSLEENLYKGL